MQNASSVLSRIVANFDFLLSFTSTELLGTTVGRDPKETSRKKIPTFEVVPQTNLPQLTIGLYPYIAYLLLLVDEAILGIQIVISSMYHHVSLM